MPPPHLQPHSQPQQQQIGRQIPPPDQNQNIHPHIQGKANSRASSSSGGNASTVHGGSIGGSTVAGNIGPSPSGTKQEQRLTHEQVIFFLFYFNFDFYSFMSLKLVRFFFEFCFD